MIVFLCKIDYIIIIIIEITINQTKYYLVKYYNIKYTKLNTPY